VKEDDGDKISIMKSKSEERTGSKYYGKKE
jgi:hypothetical protein